MLDLFTKELVGIFVSLFMGDIGLYFPVISWSGFGVSMEFFPILLLLIYLCV